MIIIFVLRFPLFFLISQLNVYLNHEQQKHAIKKLSLIVLLKSLDTKYNVIIDWARFKA